MLNEEEALPRITTSCSDLDKILVGGISCKDVTEIGNPHLLYRDRQQQVIVLIFVYSLQVEYLVLARLRLGKIRSTSRQCNHYIIYLFTSNFAEEKKNYNVESIFPWSCQCHQLCIKVALISPPLNLFYNIYAKSLCIWLLSFLVKTKISCSLKIYWI